MHKFILASLLSIGTAYGQINVEFPMPGTHLDHSKSSADMKAMKGGNDDPLGLTVFKMHVTTFKPNIGQRDGCYTLNGQHVKIEVTKLTIYTSSKYPIDSCQTRNIVEHETRHVYIDVSSAMKLQSTINNDLNALKKICFKQPDDVERSVTDLVHIDYNDMNRQQIKRNGLLDSKNSYRYTTAQCLRRGGW